MSKHWLSVLGTVVGIILLAGSASEVSAQGSPGIGPYPTAELDRLPFQLKYDRGQTVQPVFEGWSPNDDGTFELHFGYFNRNYVQEPYVPVGPDNRFETGNADQGQPTFFHIRDNRNVFTITVPSDFPRTEKVTWSLTTQGQTLTATGWLDPEWEITAGGRGLDTGQPDPDEPVEEEEPNAPPQVTVSGPLSVTLPARLTITAMVTDDGRPVPEPEEEPQAGGGGGGARGGGPPPPGGDQNSPPLITRPADAVEIPVNLPWLQDLTPPNPPNDRLTVSYWVWRGPADIRAEPYHAEVAGGSATTTIAFTEPGEYQLRVTANDGEASTEEFVTVLVQE